MPISGCSMSLQNGGAKNVKFQIQNFTFVELNLLFWLHKPSYRELYVPNSTRYWHVYGRKEGVKIMPIKFCQSGNLPFFRKYKQEKVAGQNVPRFFAFPTKIMIGTKQISAFLKLSAESEQ